MNTGDAVTAQSSRAQGGAGDVQGALPWIVALTLIGLVLRLINVDSGLWLDEIYSLVNQFRLPVSEVFTTYIGDNQHPLYAVLASASVSLFGEHAWSIRLPAVIFGVATIPALYLFGAAVTDRREALLAAGLLTFSYHHVWFSQNARGYSALALAALICSFYFLRLLRERRNGDIWMYAVVAALGCYAHLTMVFVVVGHFLVYVPVQFVADSDARRFANWQRPLLAFVAAGLFTLALYGPIFSEVIDYFVNKPSYLVDLSTPMWALKEAIRSLSIGFGAGAVVAVGVLMTLVGLLSYLRSNPVAAAVFTLPIFVTILGAFMARGTMYPRFFFALVGFGILIGVRGVMVTVGWLAGRLLSGEARSDRARAWASAAMILGIAISAVSLTRNYLYPKMDFEGARAWAEQQRRDGQRIVVAGAASWPYREFYGVGWPEMKVAADVRAQFAGGEDLWMVYTFGRYMAKSAPEVMALIRERCVDEKRFYGTLGGGDVIVCRLPAG